MDITSLLISAASGLAGGNAAGAALKDKSLGTVGNSITGLLGGGIGGAILQLLGILGTGTATGSGVDLSNISTLIGNVVGTGVCGAILTGIVGVIKAYMDKKGQS